MKQPNRFMVRRHEAEADMRRQRRASAVDGVQRNGGGKVATG